MGSQEDRPASLEEAKARFLREAEALTPSAWIRKHPDAAVGGAFAAGFLLGSSPEVQEAAIQNLGSGARLVSAFLEGLRESAGGKGTGKN